jgi:outer membrane murein-binding lipoprotein Lpp
MKNTTLKLALAAGTFTGFLLVGCGNAAHALTPTQVGREQAAQQEFKNELSKMTPQQMAEKFKSDPARARAMLMPPGMGDPALRMRSAPTASK